MERAGTQTRPVPAPRRLYADLQPNNYENIQINSSRTSNSNNSNNNNNSKHIHVENLHQNSLPKQPPPGSHSKLILQQPSSDEQAAALQPIYGPDANENVPDVSGGEAIYAVPQPAPRQKLEKNEIDAPPLLTKLRPAPKVPPKPLNIEPERKYLQRSSICSEFSTTSQTQQPADDTDSRYDDSDDESSQSGKFKSPSPGYVQETTHSDGELQDEGAASERSEQSGSSADERDDNSLVRLLGTSIGERMASRAKDAKKLLTKNLRSSTDAINNLSTDASARLKHASKRIGSNFSLTRRDKAAINGELCGSALPCDETTTAEMGFDRRQTVPNSDVFNAIQFSSPLQRNVAGGGLTDLSVAPAKTLEQDDDAYEVPRSTKRALRPSLSCHETESLPKAPVPRQHKAVAQTLALQAIQLVQQRNQHQQQEQLSSCSEASSEATSRASADSSQLDSPPMPTFAPPALPAAEAPVRQKRRKNYEEIQLRRCGINENSSSSSSSLCRQADSAELKQLNQAAAAAERKESLLMHAQIAAAEACTPKPERSDSWEFYGDELAQEGSASDTDSSPEPVYANHEATYGKLFEMATVGSNVLAPHNELASINEEQHGGAAELDSSEGAVGGWALPAPEVIQEFDPLMSKPTTLVRSNKSNALLLLENLLAEETYGTLKRENENDDVSMCTSEEDSGQVCKPAATVALPPLADSGGKPKIVHQNAQLLSDSMEHMLDEARAPPVDKQQAQSGRNQSHWFVDDTAGGSSPPNIEGDSPPTYLEAISSNGKSPPAPAEGKPTTVPSTLSSRLKQTMNAISNVKIRVDAMKRKASFKTAPQRQSDLKVALQMVPRPSLSPLLVRHEGPLIRFPSGVVEDILKDMQNRKAILRDRQFQTYLDQEMKTPKECIPLEAITTLQCVSNSRVTDNSTHFYCFELTTSVPKNGSSGGSGSSSSSAAQAMSANPNLVMTSSASGNCKQQRVAHLYGVGKESERGVWMQKLLESLCCCLPVKYTCHYYRAGWCYLKNSITSEWSGTWLVLRKNQRRLIFANESTRNVEKMDLRKARCIVLKESDDSIDNLHVETGPMLMIDCPPYSVYMIMSSARETKIWRHIIREVAHNNGFSLGEQQLTRFDVPVIVDKCINFVYIHGSMSEGIYRKSGSENSMHKLMTAFRADAFNVEITRNEYNEHDVANVLKRFMRDLPDRLLGKMTESFVFVTELTDPAQKLPVYGELLARLSIIERETLRRIVGHLVFISSQQAKNKMSVQNLTMIWGPTLLAKKTEEAAYSQTEADVLKDLIQLHKNLFPCSKDELKKETAMLKFLQKYYAAETLKDSVRQSGDIKIWINLNPNPENTSEEKLQVNATISPTKTAYELCREYASKMQLPTHQLTLYEVILNDSLERPLHHDTKVFGVILNWSYWPEDDRKHNYLVIRPLEMLREVQRAVKNLATVTPGKELRFADYRTKTFKTLQCELRDGKIVVSKKDKNDKTSIVREIFLHSSTAYLGCERKRDFPWSWAITFVERTQSQIMRSRDAPYIGHVLAGSEWVDRTIWYSSIWYCLHGDNILPPAEIIIK